VLGSRLIGTICEVDLQSLYAQMFERGLSARTIEYTNAVLESAFRQAVRWKMLAEDPCVGVDLPRVKRKEMEALSVEECRRFLDVAAKSEWFPVLALALTTGMRPSEYLALKWTDIDWQRGTASVCRTIQVSGAEWTFDDTKRKRRSCLQISLLHRVLLYRSPGGQSASRLLPAAAKHRCNVERPSYFQNSDRHGRIFLYP
jgi:integrase